MKDLPHVLKSIYIYIYIYIYSNRKAITDGKMWSQSLKVWKEEWQVELNQFYTFYCSIELFGMLLCNYWYIYLIL